uniref:probable ubiquitin-conjugating enzyme E2 23 n=1 Tax=Erigeron canadensis TaxID=72917 RepID=UPI001CB9D74E|nr:probable ubiquitin-conjugating enzyme E2 23 [Erigeron canadensis]
MGTWWHAITLNSAYRSPHCKSKRDGLKDTYPDDILAPVSKDFEDLVIEHFRVGGHYILKACDERLSNWVSIEDTFICETSIPNANSVGFKLMLAKIVPKFLSALNEVYVYEILLLFHSI